MKRIYLDYAASTPVDPQVLLATKPYFRERFGNPGSLHTFGQEAIAAVDYAREVIAKMVGANFREIIFTASATEANNLALRGVLKAAQVKNPKIITSPIEHESVMETCKDLEKEGVEVIYLPVSKEGFVDTNRLKKDLDERVVLVSIIYASNEIGTIQPIKEVGEIIRAYRGNHPYPVFHSDAVQVLQFLDLKVNELGLDLMTLSSQKIYGPKGAACLYLKKGLVQPIVTGGIQEFGLRAGTENVPAIVGFAKAAEVIQKNKTPEGKRIEGLRDYLWRSLKAARPELELNGSLKNRLPNNLNIFFPHHEAEDLIIKLDLLGIAVSAGSACSGRSHQPSYIIEALGFRDRASRSLRISLGRPTTKLEIDKAIKQIINVVQ